MKEKIINIDAIAKKTGYSPFIVCRILDELEKDGLVVSNGRGKIKKIFNTISLVLGVIVVTLLAVEMYGKIAPTKFTTFLLLIGCSLIMIGTGLFRRKELKKETKDLIKHGKIIEILLIIVGIITILILLASAFGLI